MVGDDGLRLEFSSTWPPYRPGGQAYPPSPSAVGTRVSGRPGVSLQADTARLYPAVGVCCLTQRFVRWRSARRVVRGQVVGIVATVTTGIGVDIQVGEAWLGVEEGVGHFLDDAVALEVSGLGARNLPCCVQLVSSGLSWS